MNPLLILLLCCTTAYGQTQAVTNSPFTVEFKDTLQVYKAAPLNKVEVRGVLMSDILQLLKELDEITDDPNARPRMVITPAVYIIPPTASERLRMEAERLEKQSTLKKRLQETIKKLEEK